jgi:N-acetylmuramoyl-L-alanine amidase
MQDFLTTAKYVGSPYWSPRNGFSPEAVVLHIMDGTLAGCDSWFNNNPYGVSAHLGMNEQEIHQYVWFSNAAHANGGIEVGHTSKLITENGYQNPNDWTVSIEMEGVGPAEPTPVLFEKAAVVVATIFKNVLFKSGASGVAIDRGHILKHSDISPQTRKNCPGWSEATMSRFISRVKAIHETPAPTQKTYDDGFKEGRTRGIQDARSAIDKLG